MSREFPESDWKHFRRVRELALERFCRRALEEVEALPADTARSHHERYLAVFHVLEERNAQLARAFNDPKRSQMLFQLATICSLSLLEANEIEGFSPQTRARIEVLQETFKGHV